MPIYQCLSITNKLGLVLTVLALHRHRHMCKPADKTTRVGKQHGIIAILRLAVSGALESVQMQCLDIEYWQTARYCL